MCLKICAKDVNVLSYLPGFSGSSRPLQSGLAPGQLATLAFLGHFSVLGTLWFIFPIGHPKVLPKTGCKGGEFRMEQRDMSSGNMKSLERFYKAGPLCRPPQAFS